MSYNHFPKHCDLRRIDASALAEIIRDHTSPDHNRFALIDFDTSTFEVIGIGYYNCPCGDDLGGGLAIDEGCVCVERGSCMPDLARRIREFAAAAIPAPAL